MIRLQEVSVEKSGFPVLETNIAGTKAARAERTFSLELERSCHNAVTDKMGVFGVFKTTH